MSGYTRGGDGGETSLPGGSRVRKDCLQVAAFGSVDELNSLLGLARNECSGNTGCGGATGELLHKIQRELFSLGADLAASKSLVTPQMVEALEKEIDSREEKLPQLHHFILPGGSKLASLLHAARAVCRRAERDAAQMAASEKVNPEALAYLNRLSSLLFTLAREANATAGVQEKEWRQ